MSIDESIKETIREAVKEAFHDFSPVQQPDRPRTMTVKQAARYIGISENIMRNITHRSDFDAVLKVGGKILIITDKLDRWIDRANIVKFEG